MYRQGRGCCYCPAPRIYPRRVRQLAKQEIRKSSDHAVLTKLKSVDILPTVQFIPHSNITLRGQMATLKEVTLWHMGPSRADDTTRHVCIISLFRDYIPRHFKLKGITVYSPRTNPSTLASILLNDVGMNFYGNWRFSATGGGNHPEYEGEIVKQINFSNSQSRRAGEEQEMKDNIVQIGLTGNDDISRQDTSVDFEIEHWGFLQGPITAIEAGDTRPKDIIPAIDVQLKLT